VDAGGMQAENVRYTSANKGVGSGTFIHIQVE